MSVCRGLLPCLASIVASEALGLVLDLLRGCAYFLNLGPEEIVLMKTTTGHLCVSLMEYPASYPEPPDTDDGRSFHIHHLEPQRIYIAAITEESTDTLQVERTVLQLPMTSQRRIWMPAG